jgi:sialate O-acetylesterase
MQATKLLKKGQVLQRNAENVCDYRVQGEFGVDGVMEIEVFFNDQPIKGFKGKSAGEVRDGKIDFSLRGIEVGGPYRVVFRVGDTEVAVDEIFVGDVWILGGQSNMEGTASLKEAESCHEMVRSFSLLDKWGVAKDPLHESARAVDEVHELLKDCNPLNRAKHLGTGPGVSFGKQMYEFTGVPVGLVPCAHGGTSMRQWSPSLKGEGGKSLYGAMLRRFRAVGGQAAGILWFQGSADATEKDAKRYSARMKGFIESVRSDFGMERLPFVLVQLGSFCWNELIEWAADYVNIDKYWNYIQQEQLSLSGVVDDVVTVASVDLGMDDEVHIDGAGQGRLGRRMARGAWEQKCGKKSDEICLRPGKISKKRNRYTKNLDIEITFSNVEGDLMSAGRPAGFGLGFTDGRICNGIYRTELSGAKVILRTCIPYGTKKALYLYYGFGSWCYCNITDSCDRGLPAFGPVRI